MKRTIPIAVGTLAIILAGFGTATQHLIATAVPGSSAVAAARVTTPRPSLDAAPEPTLASTPASKDAASPERTTVVAMASLLYRWNVVAGRVVADINDSSLDVEHFGLRTKADRQEMHTILADMKASISPDIDDRVGEVLTEIIGGYNDKLTGIDSLAVASTKGDYAGVEAAFAKLQRGIDRSMAAVPRFGEAIRPFSSDEEYEEYQAIFGRR